MRINHATPKRAEGQIAINQIPQGEDPTNTTVFIGGLDPSITEEDLREYVCAKNLLENAVIFTL
jgi:RNA recognition motif-containing protein